jgi:hypothetical protein
MKDLSAYIAKKQKLQDKQQNTSNIDSQTIMHLFSRAVREEYGRQGEKNIVPSFYKNGIIFVKIQNSIWAQELWTNRSLFVQLLNEKIGSNTVKNIKIAT